MSLLGSLTGGIFGSLAAKAGADAQREYINSGRQQYLQNATQGLDALRQGQQGVAGAYLPFTQLSGQGTGLLSQTVGNAAGNAWGEITPSTVTPWLANQSNYAMQQANNAMQASALAKGGMGGGLAKALSNNAQQFAGQNWNNAFQNALAARNANQGWQQQQYNQQMGLANLGLQGTQQAQGLNQSYLSGINNAFENIGSNLAGLENAKANAVGNMWGTIGGYGGQVGRDFGNNMAGAMPSTGLLSQIFG